MRAGPPSLKPSEHEVGAEAGAAHLVLVITAVRGLSVCEESPRVAILPRDRGAGPRPSERRGAALGTEVHLDGRRPPRA